MKNPQHVAKMFVFFLVWCFYKASCNAKIRNLCMTYKLDLWPPGPPCVRAPSCHGVPLCEWTVGPGIWLCPLPHPHTCRQYKDYCARGEGLWTGGLLYDVIWCVVLHDVTRCHMVLHDVTWCYMMSHDVTWCYMVLHDVTWCYMSHESHGVHVTWCYMSDVTWCYMMSHNVTWCYMMSHGVTWCHMVPL